MTDAKQLTIRDFPADIRKQAKLAAIQQGITLNQWLIEAIRLATISTKSSLTAGKE